MQYKLVEHECSKGNVEPLYVCILGINIRMIRSTLKRGRSAAMLENRKNNKNPFQRNRTNLDVNFCV